MKWIELNFVAFRSLEGMDGKNESIERTRAASRNDNFLFWIVCAIVDQIVLTTTNCMSSIFSSLCVSSFVGHCFVSIFLYYYYRLALFCAHALDAIGFEFNDNIRPQSCHALLFNAAMVALFFSNLHALENLPNKWIPIHGKIN
jgi:hypothetical protein